MASNQQGESPSGTCFRCVTPAKCNIHGCCPGTWPAEETTELERLRAIARDAAEAATELQRDVLAVRRYCAEVRESGSADARAVALSVSRMLARPPTA